MAFNTARTGSCWRENRKYRGIFLHIHMQQPRQASATSQRHIGAERTLVTIAYLGGADSKNRAFLFHHPFHVLIRPKYLSRNSAKAKDGVNLSMNLVQYEACVSTHF
jgi:hypothetical protein